MGVNPVAEGSWQDSMKPKCAGTLNFLGLVYATSIEINLPQHLK